MGHPAPPPWPPPPWQQQPPRRDSADTAISIIVMVVTVLGCGAGAVMGLFSLAFLDYCPPASCSADGAVTAVLATVAIAALTGLTGLILTATRLTKRRKAWPVALGTLAACACVFFLGAIAYTAAVS